MFRSDAVTIITCFEDLQSMLLQACHSFSPVDCISFDMLRIAQG